MSKCGFLVVVAFDLKKIFDFRYVKNGKRINLKFKVHSVYTYFYLLNIILYFIRNFSTFPPGNQVKISF